MSYSVQDLTSAIEMIIGDATALHRKKKSSYGTLVKAIEGYLNEALLGDCKCELIGDQINVKVFWDRALVLQRSFLLSGEPAPQEPVPTLLDEEFDFS